MEDKKVNWEYFELSADVPGMDEILAIRQDTKEFVVEFVGWDNEEAKVVFPTPSIIAFRKMRTQDTYEFANGDGSYAGLVSVSDNSHFLEWYRNIRLVNSEEIEGMATPRAYALHTDSDIMEVISFAPPKVFYSGSNIAVEKGDKEE